MLDETRAEVALRKFGPVFMDWLNVFGHSADFFVMWERLNGDQTAEWAAILCLGHAFTEGSVEVRHILHEHD